MGTPLPSIPFTQIVIHYSESPFGTVEMIRQWHMIRGWSDIAYHWVIRNGVDCPKAKYRPEMDGVIESGRPENYQGIGVKGHHDGTLEVCLVGMGIFTDKQMTALQSFIVKRMEKYPTIKGVVGHNFWEDTSCPGFNWKRWLKDMGLPVGEK
jgi:N-acetylmuramoyl-L-alanine amidase